MPVPKSVRRLYSAAGAHKSWSQTEDRAARTAPARAGLRAKFAAEIDPHGTLAPADLERRVDSAVRAHMAMLAARSAQARASAKRPKPDTAAS